jgi:peptide/nickel transport system substrate-binding protein
MFKMHTLGRELVLVPNPHYFKGPTGPLGQLEADFGVNENTGLLRIERGQADLDGDGIPAADFLSVINDPKWKAQVSHVLQVGEWYIAMNTQMPYFNNVLVRRAVNMAINKPLIVRLINGRGRVATTVLPPNVPGYRSFNLYPYNLVQAQRLMAKAGYPHGFSTTFYTDNVGDDPRIAQAIVPMLAQIGIKATLRVLNANTFLSAVGTKGQVPISWDAVFADFPDPNVFWEPILSCESAIPGSINEAWYCDPRVDALGRRLKTMQTRATRMEQYGTLDRMIMQDAPIVPVYYPVYYDLHSASLRNYFYHVVWEYVFEKYSKR